MFLEKIERDGKQYLYFKSINLNLSIENLSFHFNSDDFNILKEMINEFDDKVLLKIFTSSLEKGTSKNFLELCNNFCKHFTFDELLPDRK